MYNPTPLTFLTLTNKNLKYFNVCIRNSKVRWKLYTKKSRTIYVSYHLTTSMPFPSTPESETEVSYLEDQAFCRAVLVPPD